MALEFTGTSCSVCFYNMLLRKDYLQHHSNYDNCSLGEELVKQLCCVFFKGKAEEENSAVFS